MRRPPSSQVGIEFGRNNAAGRSLRSNTPLLFRVRGRATCLRHQIVQELTGEFWQAAASVAGETTPLDVGEKYAEGRRRVAQRAVSGESVEMQRRCAISRQSGETAHELQQAATTHRASWILPIDWQLRHRSSARRSGNSVAHAWPVPVSGHSGINPAEPSTASRSASESRPNQNTAAINVYRLGSLTIARLGDDTLADAIARRAKKSCRRACVYSGKLVAG